jgi:hypothetical protein
MRIERNVWTETRGSLIWDMDAKADDVRPVVSHHPAVRVRFRLGIGLRFGFRLSQAD